MYLRNESFLSRISGSTGLTIDNSDDFLTDGTGPQTQPVPTSTNPPTTGTPATLVDVTMITSALSAAMLTKSSPSHIDVFMKNKGRGDDMKPLKEAKQWNACGEIQANTSDTNLAPSTAPTTANPTAPSTQIQVSGATVALETQSILTGALPSVVLTEV